MKKLRRGRPAKVGFVKKIKTAYQSLEDRIIILLKSRNDVTRLMLPGLLNVTQEAVDQALYWARRHGFRIFPSKGPGTPLRIATGQTDSEKYINWNRSLKLASTRRMIVTEFKIAEQYPQLSEKKVELLEILNQSTNEL